MKSPLIIPRYTHNLSKTINMLVLGGSYMYVNRCGYKTYFVYKCGRLSGDFYSSPQEACTELIRHETTEGLTKTPIRVNRYK